MSPIFFFSPSLSLLFLSTLLSSFFLFFRTEATLIIGPDIKVTSFYERRGREDRRKGGEEDIGWGEGRIEGMKEGRIEGR